jgi:hypothetical protein
MRMLQSVLLLYLIVGSFVASCFAIKAGSAVSTILAIAAAIFFIVRFVQHGREGP